MKYIRTKDNRIICITGFDIDLETNCYVKGDIRIKLSDAIKGTEQLEELCDGFIFKDTHTNELHFLDTKSGISLLGAALFEETLRGFIETDKGLIYVAKINDKGEFELL